MHREGCACLYRYTGIDYSEQAWKCNRLMSRSTGCVVEWTLGAHPLWGVMTIDVTTEGTRNALVRKVEAISGQDARACFNCGTCTAACPMTEQGGVQPRRIMRMLQLGRISGSIPNDMANMCASCHACMVCCPRGLDIPRILEAVRLIALRNNEDYLPVSGIPEVVIGDLPQAGMVAGLRKMTA